jgi:DNA-binding response OmpR family regulator
VLVLEDDLCLKTVLVRMLQMIDPGIEVCWTTTGAEAMREMASHLKSAGSPFHLVIADISTPGEKSGLDLWNTCALRFPKTPFLFISAMPVDAFLRLLGTNRLCPPFLPKPFSLGECRQIVEGLLKYESTGGTTQ